MTAKETKTYNCKRCHKIILADEEEHYLKQWEQRLLASHAQLDENSKRLDAERNRLNEQRKLLNAESDRIDMLWKSLNYEK